MKQKRLLLYLTFAVYQVCAFVFTVMVDGHMDLLGLLKFIPWFKYISFLGLLLMITDITWYWIDQRAARKREEELTRENNALKAKLYDKHEASKGTGTSNQL